MRRSKRLRQASLDAMDVATRFVNAANQHDSDGLVACVHRDFQSIQPVHPERNFRGVGQLRNNWEAIFRSEPGFRLTVLRSTATDDTVWMELHGAGDDEEAAGTFILGIEGGRIRWIRVYSDLIQPMEEVLAEVAEPGLIAVPDLTATDAHPAGTGGEMSELDNWDAVVADRPTEVVPDIELASSAAGDTVGDDDGLEVDGIDADGGEPEGELVAEDGEPSASTDTDINVGGAEANADAAGDSDGDGDGDSDKEPVTDHAPEPAPKKSWLRLLRGKAKT